MVRGIQKESDKADGQSENHDTALEFGGVFVDIEKTKRTKRKTQ